MSGLLLDISFKISEFEQSRMKSVLNLQIQPLHYV